LSPVGVESLFRGHEVSSIIEVGGDALAAHQGDIPMRIVEFLAGNSGRWAKAVAGLLLIILGVILGGPGWAVAVIGLAPLAAGAFTFRQHRPRDGVRDHLVVLLVASSLITYQLGAVVVASAAAGATGSAEVWFHATSYPIPDRATTVAIGALTSASSLDIVTGDSNGNVSVLINHGTGIFSAPVAYHVAASPYPVLGVAIGDVNGDHTADIVAAVNDAGATGLAVLLGNGDGTFQSPIYTPVGAGSGDGPTALAVGDFNHDGHLDVAVGYGPGGANPTVVRVFAGDGSGHFAQLGGAYYIDNTYGSVTRLLAVDLTGDGFLDLVASNNGCGYNHGVVSVLINQGTGLFTGTQSGLVCPANVAEGDFNNDHIPDLATTTGAVLQNGRLATLWLGKGDGTFPTTNTSTLGQNPGAVVAGDFNRDGNLDLIAADGTNLVFGAGNGDGTFRPGTLFPDGSANVDVAVGDLNGDGKPDLVTVGYDVTVLLNQEPASGQALIAGVVQGPNGPLVGAPVEACPTVGGACIVASAPTDAQGRYDIPVSPGTYTVTTLPPAASALGTRTLGPVTVQGVTIVDFNILQPLPPTGTLTTPDGTQGAGVPSVNWGEPSSYTVTGCIGGFGVLNVSATNTTTGQVEVRPVPLTETPPGSGKYVGQIPALAPLHGLASVSQSITCPGHSSILPDGGALAGGTTVLLAGSGFTGARGVLFGATPASSFKVLQDNLISAVSPPGSGAVSVTVTNALGVTLPIGTFTYFEVTSISPNAGPATGGGQAITITGQGFTNVKQVIFGLVPASSFTVVSPSQIQAVPPAGVGTVDVQVLNGFAISPATLADYYTYQGGPAGTASIVEGTGDTAPAQLAAQLTVYCASGPISSLCQRLPPYINGTLFGFSGNGPIGVLASAGITSILTLAVGFAFGAELAALVGPVVGIGFLVYGLINLACAQGCDFFGLKIDPSGSVVDTTGNPVNGATVTLLAQGGPAGSFSAVPPSSALIDPAANPEATGVSGGFEWEAVAGTYEVQASAPGCNSPGNPSQANVTGPPFALPPPAVGLFLTLECPGTARPTPVVTGLSQNVGGSSGGNQVQIEGTGLTGASAVHFGAAAASAVTAISPYAVVAVAPPGSGTLDVSVTTPGGTSPLSSLDQYTYVSIPSSPQAPTISSLSPNNGPVTGGTAVTITGTNLDGVFGISFGGIPSPQVAITSATQVTATAPAALLAGPVDISVTSGQGVSPGSSGDTYTYGVPGGVLKSPTVTTISSSQNPAVFGQSVTFTALTTSTAGTPSGTVTFSDGASALPGCINVALGGSGGNTATCSTSVLSAAASPHTVTASYGGTATFDVSQASVSQTVTPAPAPVAPVFTADTPPTSAVAGTPYTYTFTATGTPAPTFAVHTGALPTGLTLNPTTGVLSGTPTTTGPSTFTVAAHNTVSPDALTPSITVTITPACPVVIGAIGVRYAELGGCNSFLGKAISTELPAQGGRYTPFEHGDIYWSPASGAHEIAGAIAAAWASQGHETGPLGYPTTGEFDFLFGRVSLFQHGFIYWTPLTGPLSLHW
jgi:LGFP repeat/Bacterial Ig-like domain (group 3)/IPT/TIG domain/FG-GAP-like repeat/Putative Ig domain